MESIYRQLGMWGKEILLVIKRMIVDLKITHRVEIMRVNEISGDLRRRSCLEFSKDTECEKEQGSRLKRRETIRLEVCQFLTILDDQVLL